MNETNSFLFSDHFQDQRMILTTFHDNCMLPFNVDVLGKEVKEQLDYQFISDEKVYYHTMKKDSILCECQLI